MQGDLYVLATVEGKRLTPEEFDLKKTILQQVS